MTFKKHTLLTTGIFLFIIIGLLFRHVQFSTVPFNDWDESMYAQVSREILSNKSIITTFNGNLWLDKPILSYGLIAFMFMVFGESEFYARLVMLFFGIGMLILVYFLTRDILSILFSKKLNRMHAIHKEVIYLLPVVILAQTPSFLERSLFLNTDLMLGFAWLGFFLFRKSYILKLLFLIIGTLTKSVIGLYPLVVNAFATVFKMETIKKLWWQPLLLILIPLIWHIYSYVFFGDVFIQTHIRDQVAKRLFQPIELHGLVKTEFFDNLEELNKQYTLVPLSIAPRFFLWMFRLSYYPLLVWENLGWLTVFISITYIILAVKILKIMIKKRLKSPEDMNWWPMLILISPLPYFLMLCLSKTKISWYMITLLPLFTVAISYLYLKLPYAFIRSSIYGIAIFMFLINFLPRTYFLQVYSDEDPLNVQRASCISQLDGYTLGVLVDENERDIQEFILQNNFQTSSSFQYGGSPSFVYYSEKPIKFFYDVEEFINSYHEYEIITLSSGDYSDIADDKSQGDQNYFFQYDVSECTKIDQDWVVLQKMI